MQELKAFCFHCRDSRTVRHGKEVMLKNGGKALRGSCVACRQEIYKLAQASANCGEAIWLYFVVATSMAFLAGYYLVKIGLLS